MKPHGPELKVVLVRGVPPACASEDLSRIRSARQTSRFDLRDHDSGRPAWLTVVDGVCIIVPWADLLACFYKLGRSRLEVWVSIMASRRITGLSTVCQRQEARFVLVHGNIWRGSQTMFRAARGNTQGKGSQGKRLTSGTCPHQAMPYRVDGSKAVEEEYCNFGKRARIPLMCIQIWFVTLCNRQGWCPKACPGYSLPHMTQELTCIGCTV